MSPRDVLNKLKWHPDYRLDEAEIEIVHRGAPRDKLTIEGENIIELGSGFMGIERSGKTVKIPYHRVLKIETSEEILWEESR